ncbi:MAG: methyltransferase domain-containing protein [Chloroflexota bacterium]
MSAVPDKWSDGDIYESYVGRWSRLVAREFITWLALPPTQRWLDLGCGTGALTATILSLANPGAVKGIDPSAGFLASARKNITDPRAGFAEGTAQAIPEADAAFDAAVSGLSLNFVPEPQDAVNEMARVVRSGGTVAAYVWDYAEKMELMRYFWDAAVTMDPGISALDESSRFPICHPDALATAFASTGLRDTETRAIDVETTFRDFDDYWTPFLGGQGSAPSYVATMSDTQRDRLRDHLRTTLPIEADGSIRLIARAWAARGTR